MGMQFRGLHFLILVSSLRSFNLKMKIFSFPVPAFASASQSVGSPLLNPAVEI